jgi:hypothetical protein
MEDGVPQKIDFFSQSEVPTNYALVVDNSGSLRSQLDKVIEAGQSARQYKSVRRRINDH